VLVELRRRPAWGEGRRFPAGPPLPRDARSGARSPKPAAAAGTLKFRDFARPNASVTFRSAQLACRRIYSGQYL